MRIVLGLLLIIATFLEGSATAIPLVLLYLLCLTILKRDTILFPVAFGAGLLLDLVSARPIGASSLFFVSFIFLILLYQRKYEIDSYPFVVFSAFLGSVLFMMIFDYGSWFVYSIVSSFVGVILFSLLRLLRHHEPFGFQDKL